MQDLDEPTVSGEHQDAQPIDKRAPADGKCVSGTTRPRPTESLRALEGLRLPPSTTLSSLHTALRLYWLTDRVDVSGKAAEKAQATALHRTRRRQRSHSEEDRSYFPALHSRRGMNHPPSHATAAFAYGFGWKHRDGKLPLCSNPKPDTKRSEVINQRPPFLMPSKVPYLRGGVQGIA